MSSRVKLWLISALLYALFVANAEQRDSHRFKVAAPRDEIGWSPPGYWLH